MASRDRRGTLVRGQGQIDGDGDVRLRELVWPASRIDYSLRTALGRLLHVSLVVIGSLPLIIELALHRYPAHLLTFAAVWLVTGAVGRLLRLLLSRE